MRFTRFVAVAVLVACGSTAWGQRETFPSAVPTAPTLKPAPTITPQPAPTEAKPGETTAPPFTPAPSAFAPSSAPGTTATRPTLTTSSDLYPPYMYSNPCPDGPAGVEQVASCVIQIDGGSDFSPPGVYRGGAASFDTGTIGLLASSTALADPVVQKSLKQKPGLVGKEVLITTTPCGRFVRLEVSLRKIDKPWPDGAANTLMSALVDRLRVAAEESKKAENAATKTRLATVVEQLAAVKARNAEIAQSMQSVRDALGQSEMFNDPAAAIRNLRTQKHQIESQLAPLKSRLEFLREENLAACENNLKAAEKALADAKEDAKKNGTVDESISEAEKKLAEAKAKLAVAHSPSDWLRDYGNAPVATPYGVATPSYGVPATTTPVAPASSYAPSPYPQPVVIRSFNNNEACNIKFSMVEQQSRLKPLDEQLAKLESPGMAAKLAGWREQQQEEQRLTGEIVQLSQRVGALQQAARDCNPVTITVLDGQSK